MEFGDIGKWFTPAEEGGKGYDPYLLSIVLGSMGRAFSQPGTWGHELGGVATEFSRGMKFAQAATKEKAERKEFMDKLLQMLGGGLTPKEQPGPTSLKMGPDKMTLEISTPSEMGLRGPEGKGEGREPTGDLLRNLLGPW